MRTRSNSPEVPGREVLVRLIVAFLGLQATACHQRPNAETSLEGHSRELEYRARLEAFDSSGSFIEVSRKVHEELAKLSADLALPDRCSKDSDEKVVALWSLLTWAAFYSLEAEYAGRAYECLETMRSRKIDSPPYARDTHYSLAINFRADLAQLVRAQYPELDLPKLPEIRDKREDQGGISVLKIARPEPYGADVVSLPLRGDSIIVIASGSCAFSQNAARDIAGDKELRQGLEGAHWIAPPYDVLSVEATRQWNETYPKFQMSVMYEFSKLEQLRLATPTFVHLRDGVIIEHFSGWTGAGEKEKLRELLRSRSLVEQF